MTIHTQKPTVAYRETIRDAVTVRGRHKKQSGGHGQFGDVVVEVGPRGRGEGFAFAERVHGGSVPRQYFSSVEAGAKDALARGPLGFPVVDVSVTLIDGSYHTVDSSDMAFRAAARIALDEALAKARPVLLEPILSVTIYVPSDALARASALVSARRGQILGFEARQGWNGWEALSALIPEAEIGDLIVELRSATSGVGAFETKFDHLAELSGRTAEQVIAARQRRRRLSPRAPAGLSFRAAVQGRSHRIKGWRQAAHSGDRIDGRRHSRTKPSGDGVRRIRLRRTPYRSGAWREKAGGCGWRCGGLISPPFCRPSAPSGRSCRSRPICAIRLRSPPRSRARKWSSTRRASGRKAGRRPIRPCMSTAPRRWRRPPKPQASRLMSTSPALGADPGSASPYIASKGRGETATLEGFPAAIILRPSVVFGPEDDFFNRFGALSRFLPVIPLFGGGSTRLQPVYAGDVARAAAAALAGSARPGTIYELGGPIVMTLREAAELVLSTVERRRLLVGLPLGLSRLIASASTLASNATLGLYPEGS